MSAATHSTIEKSSPDAAPALLRVEDLAVSFRAQDGCSTRAVDGVSFNLEPRKTLAIVGESGCGKSVTALSIMRLIAPPGQIERGSIHFDGQDLLALDPHSMRVIRGGRIAMIFQEPMTSLNPVLTIGQQIIEAIRLHQTSTRRAAIELAVQAMRDVGIADAGERLRQYPHQFSGGMRQRVMIAMALACRPQLLLADEPTTALDVTTQAQILQLLRDLRARIGMAMLLITHDLGVVAHNADDVCVMHAGRIVEQGPVALILKNPQHPYTRGLLACRPSLHHRPARLPTIADDHLTHLERTCNGSG